MKNFTKNTIKKYRAVAKNGKRFPTSYGYLFTDGIYSLEIHRSITLWNVAFLMRGDSIIAG